MNRHLNNEGQEHKTCHGKGRALVRERINEESKEGENGWCSFYTSVSMEH
jgi:hypothetical protein